MRVGHDQLEAFTRPIVAITVLEGEVVIRNCGAPPALNLAWKRYTGVCETKDEKRSIFPERDSAPAGSFHDLIFSQIGHAEMSFSVDYESVSGQKYRTIAEWEHTSDAKIHLRIEKLG